MDISALTQAAKDGYATEHDSTYLLSSPMDMAFRTGQWLRQNGRSMPVRVATSRGYRMRAAVAGGEVMLDFGCDSKAPVAV